MGHPGLFFVYFRFQTNNTIFATNQTSFSSNILQSSIGRVKSEHFTIEALRNIAVLAGQSESLALSTHVSVARSFIQLKPKSTNKR